jgi:phage terminase large subunit-like protein
MSANHDALTEMLRGVTDVRRFVEGLSPEERLGLLEAWDLWARPHQRMPEGKWRRWIFRGGRGSGKALHIDTPIPTPTGWSTMGDIAVGDQVFDEHGKPCTVTGATEIMTGRPCFRLTFDDGHEIIADADHEWVTWTRKARKAHGRSLVPGIHPRLRTTAEIAETIRHGHETNHSIPLGGALETPDAALPVAPYTLGYWLGNGGKETSRITIGCAVGSAQLDTCVVDSIKAEGYTVRPTSCPDVFTIPGLITELKALGVGGPAGVRHIPDVYLRASYAQRLALMQGLMDSDGYQSEGFSAAEFCSVVEDLANDLCELAISLGVKASIAEGRAKMNGIDHGPKWRVTFTTRVPVFRTARKSSRQPSTTAQLTRTTHRYIVRCEPIESVPVKCIQVDSASHLYLAGEGMIPTHNSTCAHNTIHRVARDKRRIGRGIIGIVGRTHDDVRLLNVMDKDTGILATAPKDFTPHWQPGPGILTWPNGVIGRVFSADSPEAIRGNNIAWLLADELQSWPNAEATWWAIIEPAVRVGRQQIMITLTPKPQRWLRELENMPGSVRTGARMYDNPFLTADYKASMELAYAGRELGRQELDGEFIDQVRGACLDFATIAGCHVHAAPKEFKQIVVAVDPAVDDGETSDDTGIIVYGHTADDHGYALDDQSGKYDIASGEWARHVVEVYRRWRATVVVAEINNGGKHIEQSIRAIDKSIPFVNVRASDSKRTRAEPIGQLYRRGMIHHVGDKRRWTALEDQWTTWIPGEGKSPNNLDALVWAATYCHIADSVKKAPTPCNALLGRR